MSDQFTHSEFEKYVNQQFGLSGADLSLELIECSKIKTAQEITAEMREPFSLVFRGPSEPVLNQQLYRIEHAELGPLDIFLVPIGPDDEGMKYEAVFT